MQENRWSIIGNKTVWSVKENDAHTDTIEMSGNRVSAIVTYGVNDEGKLLLHRELRYPTLRIRPRDTHSTLASVHDEMQSFVIDGKAAAEIPYCFELDGTLTSRDTINGKMTTILDEATDQWGIKVSRVELKNIIPPAEIQNAMEKQMKAERDRRETLLQAEGHKDAAITRAEGDKRAMVLAAEGERDARIARAEGEAKAILLAKQAEAEGIRLIREANPDAAVIELKKYDALVRMGDGKASKIIIPTDAVNAVTSNVLFSESTGLGDVTKSAPEKKAAPKKDECCERFGDRAN